MSGRSRLLVHGLTQTAIWWSNPTDDGYGGKTFASAIDIPVRWVDHSDINPKARQLEVVSMGNAYVDRDVSVGDFLMLGTAASLLPGANQPHHFPKAWMIHEFIKTPSLDGRRFVRRVLLTRIGRLGA